jgi:hypothetical protein
MTFLNREVFTPPAYLTDISVLRRIESDGNVNRVTAAQTRTLSAVLSNARLVRMVELEELARNKSTVYTLSEMLTDLRRGLWSEIQAGRPIDAYRRRLQATYLEQMASKIAPPSTPTPPPGFIVISGPSATRDIRPLIKDEMRMLDRELAAAIGRTSDRMTRAHLQDSRDVIAKMLKID